MPRASVRKSAAGAGLGMDDEAGQVLLVVPHGLLGAVSLMLARAVRRSDERTEHGPHTRSDGHRQRTPERDPPSAHHHA